MNLPLFKKQKDASYRPGKKGILYSPALPYLVSFFVPILVMLIIFAGKQIFPFGNRSFLRTDLYHQYAPFFQEYKDKLAHGESLYFTWDIGLGTNFMSLYAYYLSSPINFLLFFCPRGLVIEFITYGIVFRMALSSLTMTYYLNTHNHTARPAAALFGIFYGLSGYMAAYSWNIMWLDCLFLFPLIILGLERLIRQNRCLLYCFSLALCIYSNYYISIMVCMSVVLIFAVDLILLEPEDGNYVKRVFSFALYSLLAGGLASVMLFPEIAALSSTASGSVNFPSSVTSYFSMFDMLSRHLMNVEVEIGLDHWPNIYCGVAVLLFIPLYIMSRKVPFKEKAANLLLLVFFLLSFSLNILNFIWHGFHYPNSLPCRQSFVYIFLVLSMSFKGFLDVRRRTPKEIAVALVTAVGFVILAEKLGAEYTGTKGSSTNDDYYVWYTFYLSIGFLIIYGALTNAWIFAKKRFRPLIFFTVLVFTVIESTVNMSSTSVTTVNRSDYVKDDLTVRAITKDIDAVEGNSFYRMERTAYRTKNDGAWFDFRSVSIFSSMAYADLTAFYKKIGMESSTNAYGSMGQSWASLMLLGAKYSISMKELPENSLRRLFEQKDGVWVYENTYALPVGFLVEPQLSETWNNTDVNPAYNWNSLSQALTGKQLFIEQTDIADNTSTNVTVTVTDPGYLYIYVNKSGGPDKVKVTHEGTGKSKDFSNLGRSYFLPLDALNDVDTVEAGDVVRVANNAEDKTKNLTLTAWVLDESVLAEMYERLNETPLQVTRWDTTSIEGTVDVKKAGTMLFTIPCDKGWTAYVDGVAVEKEAYKDAFLSFPLSAGSHQVRIVYRPNGFIIGLLVSVVSLLLLFMIRLLEKQIALAKAKKEEEEARLAKEEMISEDDEALLEEEALFPEFREESDNDSP